MYSVLFPLFLKTPISGLKTVKWGNNHAVAILRSMLPLHQIPSQVSRELNTDRGLYPDCSGSVPLRPYEVSLHTAPKISVCM